MGVVEMKVVYVFHNKFREMDPIVIFRENDNILLSEEELEAIFRAHNLSVKRKLPALTGFFDWEEDRMGIVDPEYGIVYICKPIGWEIRIS